MTRVCRVLPDVPALEREFDYLVPDELVGTIAVGTIVRVPLHGRRVRGWIVALDVETEAPGRLLPLAARSSEGPDAVVIDLARWVAHRFAGPVARVLRAASPANNVQSRAQRLEPTGVTAVGDDGAEVVNRVLDEALVHAGAVIRWPPLLDRRHLVAGLIAPHGSTIVVTGDGHRARALVEWLRTQGRRAYLDRSDVGGAERTATWRAATAGECVVVGGRVAAFAPVPDLAAAIVVDDGDETLQDERAPTWHARDVLVERASRGGARFAVVAAAPTLEALEGSGPLVTPPRAVEQGGWPRVTVVDRRLEPPGAGLFPEAVADALRRAIEPGPAVCVVNRRGRARLLACATCGALQRRDRSGRPLWDTARTHGAAAAHESASICQECGSTRLRVLRAGIGRLREELEALLPSASVVDVDADTELVARADVLVGTETLLYRPDVRVRRPTLVLFPDFDQELLAPRFRAAEQALLLLVRASRLLDLRDRRESRLVIATRQPDHDVVRAAVRGDPEPVALAERAQRIALGLPPFGALAELVGEPSEIDEACALLADLSWQAASVQVLGPGADGKRALVQAPTIDALADAMAAVRSAATVRIHVDPPRV